MLWVTVVCCSAALESSALGLHDASTRLVLPLRAELAAGGGEELRRRLEDLQPTLLLFL